MDSKPENTFNDGLKKELEAIQKLASAPVDSYKHQQYLKIKERTDALMKVLNQDHVP